MEVQGKVKLVGVTETVGNNGFRKRDIVVTTDEQYPQHISIQFVQDKCDKVGELNHYNQRQLKVVFLHQCLLQMLLNLQLMFLVHKKTIYRFNI